jgi:hypothetical protein
MDGHDPRRDMARHGETQQRRPLAHRSHERDRAIQTEIGALRLSGPRPYQKRRPGTQRVSAYPKVRKGENRLIGPAALRGVVRGGRQVHTTL